MRSFNLLLVLLTHLAVLALVFAGPAVAAPAVGDVAPDFLLHGTDGAVYRLSEHTGKRGVVIAWFPKAFTRA